MVEPGRFLLERNLQALQARDPALADIVRGAAPDPRISRAEARDGSAVPVVGLPGGSLPLHSLYDPAREARRLAESVRGCGCCVVFGLGAGHHVAAILDAPDVCSVLVVDKNPSVIRALLTLAPLEGLIADARVRLLAGHGAREALLRAWQPAIMGGLRTLALRAWCDQERAFFTAAAAEVQEGVEAVRADYGVQAHFGMRWTANILRNLDRAHLPLPPLPRHGSAIVAAAGPSLDLQAAEVARLRPGAVLIAADTAAPALTARGMAPDAVVSIDCQLWAYRHFMPGWNPGSVLFCDLASPPAITYRAPHAVFAAGGHPLSSYLCSRWRRLPRIDTSGGNVTHAAVGLARALGAETIYLAGADFSYPRAAMYARGTYVHDLFAASQGRFCTVESQWRAFLSRTANVTRERVDGGFRYRTPLLSAYRDRLMSLVGGLDADVVPLTGEGLPLTTVRRGDGATAGTGAGTSAPFDAEAPAPFCSSPSAPFGAEAPAAVQSIIPFEAAEPLCGWREAVDGYAEALAALQVPSRAPAQWLASLSPSQRELLWTLLPVAAAILRDRPDGEPPLQAVEAARVWVHGRALRARDLPAQR
jgi:hypothetical protein